MTATPRPGRAEIVVFAGPSVRPPDRDRFPQVSWRGPAVAGDMLKLLSQPPRCVAIIDGLFDQAPAVRHKEILLLMARGVHVVGGASMGALRAAELSAFGMVGVGRVHRAYADGRLVGDDEVALLHGPEAFDWTPLTAPLVNVRATLVAAVRARRLAVGDARRMLTMAGGVFYQDRTWDRLASGWAEAGLPMSGADGFGTWLASGTVDVKNADALLCVEATVRLAAAPAPQAPAPPDTVFTRALLSALGDADGP